MNGSILQRWKPRVKFCVKNRTVVELGESCPKLAMPCNDIFGVSFCKLILGELDLLSEPRRTQTIYAYICIYFIIHIISTHIISIDFCHVVSFGSFLEPEWTNLNWQWVLALRLSKKIWYCNESEVKPCHAAWKGAWWAACFRGRHFEWSNHQTFSRSFDSSRLRGLDARKKQSSVVKDFEGTSQKPLGKSDPMNVIFYTTYFSQWNHFLHHFQLGGVFWGFFAFTFELAALWIGCPLASHHHAMQKRSWEFKTLMWESKSDQTAWWDCWLMFLCRPFRKCSWLMFRAHDQCFWGVSTVTPASWRNLVWWILTIDTELSTKYQHDILGTLKMLECGRKKRESDASCNTMS